MATYNVKLTLTEDQLGTSPGDKAVYGTYIAAKAAKEQDTTDELESLPAAEQLEKGTTVFHRMPDGVTPCMFDYQLKGFMKGSCAFLNRADNTYSKDIKAYKKSIDGLIFVFPRKIAIAMPDGGKIGICERPLRAQTAQGERIGLARSEACPAGSTMVFQVQLLSESLEDALYEWLEYGKLNGLGQWRNAGWGRFTYECEKVEDVRFDTVHPKGAPKKDKDKK